MRYTKRISFLVLYIVILLFPSLLSKSDGITNSQYHNDVYNFVIEYPSNWEIIEFGNNIQEGENSLIVTFISPAVGIHDTFREYLTIKTMDVVKNNASLRHAIDNYVVLLKELPNFKLEKYCRSNDMYLINYSFTPSKEAIHKLEVILFYNFAFIFEFAYTNMAGDPLKSVNELLKTFNVNNSYVYPPMIC